MEHRSAAPAALAREQLDRLSARFGRAGLAAAARRPGLLAAIDQHAAAVRDRLAAGPARLAELASYADGLTDRAAELGWRPPGHGTAWATADPLTVRLLAVCALYEAAAGPDPARTPA